MRRLLNRKVVMIGAAIISFTAIPAAGIVATATPALADSYLCEAGAGGSPPCLGAPTIDSGDPILLEVGGRALVLKDQNRACCGGYEVYRLQFEADATKCVGASSAGLAEVRDCSAGDSGNVNWAWEPFGVGFSGWLSTTFRWYLAWDNVVGDRLFLTPPSGCCYDWENP